MFSVVNNGVDKSERKENVTKHESMDKPKPESMDKPKPESMDKTIESMPKPSAAINNGRIYILSECF
jgi:hypothetical protein